MALKEAGGAELTYTQLSQRIRAIANGLLRAGTVAGNIVGVFQSPNTDWICSVLAIWLIGATYVPLDKKAGMDRLSSILSKMAVAVVLFDQTTASEVHQLYTPAKTLNVSDIPDNGIAYVRNMAMATEIAVIMHTSGSTGVPKGMMISHAEYSNQIYSFTKAWKIQEAEETVLHQSSYTWDMSIFQILITLSNAGSLVIASADQRVDPASLASIIQSEKVTMTVATPTEYLSWFRYGRAQLKDSEWKTVISGGETVFDGLVQEFRDLSKVDLRLINAYGPAEATMACSTVEIPYMDIGCTSQGLRTLPNNSVYIVDESLNPVPIGIPGELVIGGAGVAKGYLDPEKTKERFMADKHASSFFKTKEWTMIHRTGDRARLTQDGGLVLMGRISGDTQIKLGGVRMNVEEIEFAITQASQGRVLQVAVSPRSSSEDDSRQFLVAFVVLSDMDSTEDQASFLEQLAHELPLPRYMRPAAIIPIDCLPQNTSSKVDRFAVGQLPIPQLPSDDTSIESLGPLEESLRELWQETIPREIASQNSIHLKSEYFHSGGTSLSLVNLQALMKERLGVSIALPRLFESSTLQSMASLIRDATPNESEMSVNWEDEIRNLLAASECDLTSIDRQHKPSGSGTVVLTGATGFIGKEILQTLIDNENVHTVHCLAVRTPKNLPEIFADPKVHAHEGNLGAVQLGLSDADAASIFNQADVIIHNGADVSFMKTYQSLKLTNVASTRELVKLATPRRIPFHFVSSATVTRLACQESFGEESLAAFPPPQVPDDGYMAAKWVCEVYLERVSEKFDIPVWIHRPSSVQGANAPELDLMSNMMRYCQETKKIPDTRSWPGGFDLVTVESVATQIVEAIHSAGSSANGVHFRYESGEIELGQNDVQTVMETGTGEQIEIVSVSEWVDLAEKAGMSPLLGMYLRKAKDGQVLLPKLIKGPRD